MILDDGYFEKFGDLNVSGDLGDLDVLGDLN